MPHFGPDIPISSHAADASISDSLSTHLRNLGQASTYFHHSVEPILSQTTAANLEATRAFLSVTLSSTRERELLLTFLAENWIPASFPIEVHKLLVDSIVTNLPDGADEAESGALAAALDFAATRKLGVLYAYLGEKLLQHGPPSDFLVTYGAEALCQFDCINAARDKEMLPWIQLLVQHGSAEAFHMLGAGITTRLTQGNLSGYDHLLLPLCGVGGDKAVDVLVRILNLWPNSHRSSSLVPDAQSVRRSNGAAIDAGLRESFRVLPAIALVTMLVHGPEYALSVYSVAPSLAYGFIQAFTTRARKERALHSPAQVSSADAGKVHFAYLAFAERTLETLNMGEPGLTERERRVVNYLQKRLAAASQYPGSDQRPSSME